MACYTINSKKGYFRILYPVAKYCDYPLVMIQEYKQQNDLTYDQVAEELTELLIEEDQS